MLSGRGDSEHSYLVSDPTECVKGTEKLNEGDPLANSGII